MAFEFPARSDRPAQRVEMFEQLASRIPSADGKVAAATKSLVVAYKELTEQCIRLGHDESATPGARLVRMAKSARAKIGPLLQQLEWEMTSIHERQTHLRGEVEKIFNPPNKSYEMVLRHQEIRALFRRMPRKDAMAALEQARAQGDEDTIIALCSYQPYLSNLPPALHQHARDDLVANHAPQHAAALEALSEQAKLTDLFRGEMAASVSALIDFRKADEIMAAARDDTAAA